MASKTPKKVVLDAKVLECLLCFGLHSRDDVKTGLYRVETMICSRCYADMQSAHYRKSCFGKPTVIVPVSNVAQEIWEKGFDANAGECAQRCPDREVCELVVQGIVSRAENAE